MHTIAAAQPVIAAQLVEERSVSFKDRTLRIELRMYVQIMAGRVGATASARLINEASMVSTSLRSCG